MKYKRIGNQQIGELKFTDPNGVTWKMTGQQSLNDEFIKQLTKGIAEGIMAGMKGGI